MQAATTSFNLMAKNYQEYFSHYLKTFSESVDTQVPIILLWEKFWSSFRFSYDGSPQQQQKKLLNWIINTLIISELNT